MATRDDILRKYRGDNYRTRGRNLDDSEQLQMYIELHKLAKPVTLNEEKRVMSYLEAAPFYRHELGVAGCHLSSEGIIKDRGRASEILFNLYLKGAIKLIRVHAPLYALAEWLKGAPLDDES